MTGRWEYLLMDVTMAAVELEKVEKYVLRRHTTVDQYIVTCMILELCLVMKLQLVPWVSMR